MELIRTESKDEIPAFDREILNEKLHLAVAKEILKEVKGDMQEFLVLGMSKGSITLLHLSRLHQLYCRFTVHREAVVYVRYLPKTKTFISLCSEQQFVIWQINKEERNIKVLHSFKIQRNLKYF